MNDMKVTWGDNVAAGHGYFINPNFLKLKVLKKKFMKLRDFQFSYDQDSEVALLTSGGQLTCGAPRYQGVFPNMGF